MEVFHDHDYIHVPINCIEFKIDEHSKLGNKQDDANTKNNNDNE